MNTSHHCLIRSVVWFALIAVAGCSKQPATDSPTAQNQNPEGPKAMKGEVYRTKDRSEAITIVSDEELELKQGGANLICKYTRQEGQLRVVANAFGMSQALYFRVTDDGLQDEHGKIFYKPSRFETVDQLAAPQHAVDQRWADVCAAYQRRKELVRTNLRIFPTTFDRSVLASLTHALDAVDAAAINATSAPDDAAQLEQFQRAQMQLSQATSRLLVVSEIYPDLKQNDAFRNFQAQLEETENQISAERVAFSGAAKAYNAQLPSGSHPKPFFAGSPAGEKAPPVTFSFGNPTATPSP